jgi:hypothetical protein
MKAKLSLSETERTEVQRFVRQGKANARTLTRVWILLNLANGWDEGKIAETFAVTQATVKNVAKRFAEGGLDLVLHDKVQQRRLHSTLQYSSPAAFEQANQSKMSLAPTLRSTFFWANSIIPLPRFLGPLYLMSLGLFAPHMPSQISTFVTD